SCGRLVMWSLLPTLSLLLSHPPTPPLFPSPTLFRSARPPRRLVPAAVRPTAIARRTQHAALDAKLPVPVPAVTAGDRAVRPLRRSEEHTSELQSRENLVCRLLLEKEMSSRQNRPSIV